MSAVVLPLALVAYIIGVFLATLSTVYRSERARVGASAVFVVACAAHLAAVIQRGVATGGFPLSTGAEYLLVFGLVVMLLYLIVWVLWRIDVAGIVLPSIAALTGFAALGLLSSGAPQPGGTHGGWFFFHTSVSTLGMAMLTVALAMSVLYIVQDRALKARRTLAFVERLPSLERCDSIGVQALLLGFVLLTVGIGTGVAINSAVHHRFWMPEVKQTLPVIAWVIFASVLAARYKLGFRGRKSAYLTIAGVMLGLLTVVGMTL